MKLIKSLHRLIILFLSFQLCFGQEKPKAVLVGSIANANCEYFLASIDGFFNDINEKPSSIGYAIIYAKNSAQIAKAYETWLSAQAYLVNLDRNRLVIKYAQPKNQFEIEFWIVPTGADLPLFVEQKRSNVLSPSTKAFRLATTFYDICPTFSPQIFADYLQANPNIRGHIVVFNKSLKIAKKDAENLLKILTEEYKVSRNRMKAFYNSYRSHSESEIEFWLVPRKKR